ncbi:sulfotransferase 1A1-like [Ruditapes philippinarum]|uniref:sulfotransferase 1A1-like n=1 Tax=Ruditapes philippinarum TaxID=129788 RepID=UPI00295A98D8|nr:sulfotransferase 1A1-like [Ruditapes philippinarum]
MNTIVSRVDYGSWFQYVKEWETYILEHSDHFIHVIFYEELHKNNVEEIKRLAKFFGLEPSEELVQAISEKCQCIKIVEKYISGITHCTEKEKLAIGKIGLQWHRMRNLINII